MEVHRVPELVPPGNGNHHGTIILNLIDGDIDIESI